MNALSTAEAATLERCEETIQRGIETFVEVGKALATIRDAQLYRADYQTFADYCVARWAMTASRARQLIDAATTVEHLRSVTDVTLLPANEFQVRPLVRLEPDEQVEVWREAVASGKPSKAAVEEVARRAYERTEKVPRIDLVAAKHRVLSAAVALLADELEYGASRFFTQITDDAAEDAGFEVIESPLVDRLARKLVDRAG